MASKEKLSRQVMPWAVSTLGFLAMHHFTEKRHWRKEAREDKLTGLLNRRGLEDKLERVRPPVALIYVDNTGQKKVNDTFGHDRGDEAIVGAANLLKDSLRPEDIVARIGGDEFVGVLTSKPREQGHYEPGEFLSSVVTRINERAQDFVRSNPDLAGTGFGIAVGGAIWHEGMPIDDVTRAAELAMYGHKAEQHEANGKHR